METNYLAAGSAACSKVPSCREDKSCGLIKKQNGKQQSARLCSLIAYMAPTTCSILDANYRESCVGTYVEVGTRPKKKDHAAVLRQRDVRIRRFCITCGDVGSNRPHADDRA